MAKAVNTHVSYQWKQTRFEIFFDGVLNTTQTNATNATFNLQGKWTLKIYDVGTRDRVIYPASDYIVFVKGDQNFAASAPGKTSSAYKHALPYGINAGSGNIICETRVDSYRYGEANGGTVWNKSTTGISHTTTPGTYTCNVNETFTLPLSGSGDQIILRYFTSGSDRNNINWIESQAWNVLVKVQDLVDTGDIMFTYRPGERKVSGTWRSHNSPNGWAERKNGTWYELRTNTGTGDPPEIKVNGSWKNQSRIGDN